ncbi:phosphatidylinositol 3 and 4-kinase-domain-containing protein [Chytriomyces sp. MP71]|nr:phosphatidylinositol 3 and 4-kinase-domain-containing protein [Chytriomyces sp. MP71]
MTSLGWGGTGTGSQRAPKASDKRVTRRAYAAVVTNVSADEVDDQNDESEDGNDRETSSENDSNSNSDSSSNRQSAAFQSMSASTGTLSREARLMVPSLVEDAALPLDALPAQTRLRDTLQLNFDYSLPNTVPPITPVAADAFIDIVREVQAAIALGIYPERIVKGSSGSYFCKNRAGKIVGVFKPKNEEPYGKMNPKWTKWLHKHFLPCMFGRSCLIPNSGYLSEAAASFIDKRLGLNVVPRTEVVALASPTFFYTWYEKWMYVRGLRPLPLKLGSFQLFLTNFKDATTFFQSGYDQALRHRPQPPLETQLSSSSLDSNVSLSSPAHPCNWDHSTQTAFQMGFERLVVLDYLIRNTDRGMDNWMIQYSPPNSSTTALTATAAPPLTTENSSATLTPDPNPYTFVPPPAGSTPLRVAAIDNGLAFPFKHPDKWRSYPFGWAYLPIARVPFSNATRDQCLYFLTSQEWWRGTLTGLERIFRLDADFSEDMWRMQRGVIRGEGYNLAEVLRRSAVAEAGEDGSPFGLVRRPVVAVYEEEEDEEEDENGGDEERGWSGGSGWTDRTGLVETGILPAGGGSEGAGGMMRRFRRRVRQRFETFRNQPFFQHF